MKRRYLATAHARTPKSELVDEARFFTQWGALRYCSRIGNGAFYYWRVHDKNCLGRHLGDCAVSGLVTS